MKKSSHRSIIIFLAALFSLTAMVIHIGSVHSADIPGMTGAAAPSQSPIPKPLSVMTDTMMMTGRSSQPLQVTTDTMTMTGRSSQPMKVTTDTMMMTGRR
jgi:hypothetical protein